MKAKQQTAKRTQPNRPSAQGANARSSKGKATANPRHSAPSVPLSVYRDLAEELKLTQTQLTQATTQNQALREQNKALRQEVTHVIETATKLRQILQHQDPRSRRTSPAQSSSPNTAAAANDTSSVLTDVSDHGKADGPFCALPQSFAAQSLLVPDVVPELTASTPARSMTDAQTLGSKGDRSTSADLTVSADLLSDRVLQQPLFTEEAVQPSPDGHQEQDEEKSINGVWLTLTLLVVVVTAFTAGFLVVLPFIQTEAE